MYRKTRLKIWCSKILLYLIIIHIFQKLCQFRDWLRFKQPGFVFGYCGQTSFGAYTTSYPIRTWESPPYSVEV